MITFSTVTLSYEKANSCKAVEIVIGGSILALGALLYGAYYVSNPDNQDNVKQALSDYGNTTAEGAQMQYEMNKKLFNDFCDYAISKAGSNAAITSADGKKYTVEDMKDEGFPSFEKWDEEMKKQSKKPTPTFGNLWDKMSFGLDLLDFIRGFYDDDDSYGSGGSGGQSYFEGENYYDKETGRFSVFADTMIYKSGSWVDDVFTYDSPIFYHFSVSGIVKEEYREDFRLCLHKTNAVYNKLPMDGETDRKNARYYMQACGYLFSYSGKLDSVTYDCYVTQDGTQNKYSPGTTFYAVLIDHFLHYDEDTKLYSFQPTNYLYLSSNMPVFFDKEACQAYIDSGDYSGAINLPPSKVTSAPTGSPEKPVTPVSIYVKNFQNKNVTVNDITNINYYIVNNWDTTTNQTQNLTTVINNYYYGTLGDSESLTDTPVPTATPVPTLINEDGGNTTNNYIINITNILQPISETVTNIYNFFQIDTQEIAYEMNFDSPAYKFDSVNKSISTLKSAVGNDSYDENTGLLKADYPKISMKCPKILAPVVDTVGEDGEKEIVIVDFKDYALWFIRLRKFLEAIMWVGMVFLLMKEIKVVFTV